MKIYTSYFAKIKKMKEHFPYGLCVVSIAQKDPGPEFSANSCKKLAPPWYVLKAYKENGDKEQYIRDYKRLVLDNIDPHKVYEAFKQRAGYGDIVLVCYEKSGDFCHRHIIAQWLRDAGYEAEEWVEPNETR